ncbi:MAG TPA: hypothetical protein VEM32_00465 [Geobacteraceae bacterium]|nr:hypothetical protein [Geobacteraceae bacterium]
MKKAIAALILLPSFPAIFCWAESRLNGNDIQPVQFVPQHSLKQAEPSRGSTIKDPALRAALEKKYQHVLAVRKEAMRQARARIRREAAEARRKFIADEMQYPTPGRNAAR